LLGAVLLFWRTAVLASTTAAIEIGPGRVSVRTSGGGHSLSLTGNPQTTHVQGPQTSGPLGNRPGLLDMPFLRIVTEAGEMDVGHGHSEADVRTIRRAIEPLISGARPKD
jgi:hypothetical protein